MQYLLFFYVPWIPNSATGRQQGYCCGYCAHKARKRNKMRHTDEKRKLKRVTLTESVHILNSDKIFDVHKK